MYRTNHPRSLARPHLATGASSPHELRAPLSFELHTVCSLSTAQWGQAELSTQPQSDYMEFSIERPIVESIAHGGIVCARTPLSLRVHILLLTEPHAYCNRTHLHRATTLRGRICWPTEASGPKTAKQPHHVARTTARLFHAQSCKVLRSGAHSCEPSWRHARCTLPSTQGEQHLPRCSKNKIATDRYTLSCLLCSVTL